MGFSGGSSNVTKAHQHDSAVVQDGGALAANATQFGLTNGSLLYSDGTNIQELGIGASGAVLGTATGTVPTWEAGGGGGGAWEQVFTDTIGSDSNVITNTFTGIDQDDYAMFCLQIQCGISEDADVLMQFHDSTGVLSSENYSTSGIAVTGGAATYVDSQEENFARLNKYLGHKCYIITAFITMGNSNLSNSENKRFSWWSTFSSGGGTAAMFSTQGGFCFKDNITSLNGITLYANAVVGGDTFQAGSKVTLWKIS